MVQVRRQVGIVFDINKCMGCQTCTVACKWLWSSNDTGAKHQWWMKVNTMPGQGSPKDWEKMGGGYDKQGKVVLGHFPSVEEFGEAWEFDHEKVFYGGGNGRDYLRPLKEATWGPNWDEDIGGGEYPNSYFFYLPRLCNACSHPSCVEACPQGAMVKREEDGVVLITENCRKTGACDYECMRACPYKVIYLNTATSKAQMCNYCLPRFQKGIAVACVRQCPGRAARIDFLDNAEGSVYQLINGLKVALPLHPEFGTKPNVYYIPPVLPPRLDKNGDVDERQARVPTEYLHSLFGPSVEAALNTLKEEMSRRRRGEKSQLMETLISKHWHDLLGPFVQDPAKIK